jgi:hypothetical protein
LIDLFKIKPLWGEHVKFDIFFPEPTSLIIALKKHPSDSKTYLTGHPMKCLAGDSLLFRLIDFHGGVVEHFLPSWVETPATLTGKPLLRQGDLISQNL